jgi:hypothetical protein
MPTARVLRSSATAHLRLCRHSVLLLPDSWHARNWSTTRREVKSTPKGARNQRDAAEQKGEFPAQQA